MSHVVNAGAGRKLVIWTLRSILCLGLIFISLLAFVYIMLQRDPDAFLRSFMEPLEAQTGLKFSIGAVGITLLPLPSLTISDLRISGKDLEFRAPWITATPSLKRLLVGEIAPGAVSLLRPRLRLRLDAPLNEPGKTIEQIKSMFGDSGASGGRTLPGGIDLKLKRFRAMIRGSEETRAVISGLDADLETDADGRLGGDIFIALFALYTDGAPLASLENFRLAGKTYANDFIGSTRNLALSGKLFYRDFLKNCRFNGSLAGSKAGLNVLASASIDLDGKGEAIPLKLDGILRRNEDGQGFTLSNFAWELGADSGAVDLAVSLPPDRSAFRMQGALQAKRLSLPQWVGFMRNLGPGMQLTLDNITRLRAEFELDGKGLAVSSLEGVCGGSELTGNGSVPDWKKPVVELHLRTPRGTLTQMLPEASGKSPRAPQYAHPPITPQVNKPLKPGETPVGYNITLSVGLLNYDQVVFRNAFVRIYPGKLDKSGFRDILVDAKGGFYGGSANGSCILGGDPSTPIYFTVKAEDVNGAALARDMTALPLRQGTLDLSMKMTSQGKELDRFLANLKGDIRVDGANLVLATADGKESFPALGARGSLRRASLTKGDLALEGDWGGTAKLPELNASMTASGSLVFSKNGLRFRNLAATGEGSLNVEALPPQTRFKLSGQFGGDSATCLYELARGKLEIAGQPVSCSFKIDAKKKPLLIQGDISAEVANINSALARLGLKDAALPTDFNRLKLSCAISGNLKDLKLERIAARLGQTQVAGSLRIRPANERMRLDTELTIDKLDLSQAFAKKKATNNDWDFSKLTRFDASGQIKIGEILIWNLRFANMAIPYRLEKGKLASESISANFYGAPMKCALLADFNKGLSFDSKFYAHAFNLGEAARARKIEAVLTGSASVDARIGAQVNGNAKLAPALNGQWSFNVDHGSWQSAGKNGAPKGKPTRFASVRASGRVVNGIVSSDNFSMRGDGMTVAGAGSLNLATQEVNCDFNVDMKGLPEFPVRIYGPFANIKTSIGAGKLVLNAMGEVVSGFAGAVSGIIKGAWNIFSR